MSDSRRLYSLLVLLLASLLLLAAVKPAAYIGARAVYMRLEADPALTHGRNDGSCGAAAVGEHVIMTAAHCFVQPDLTNPEGFSTRKPVVGETIWLNSQPRKVLEWIADRNDHYQLRVDGPRFPVYGYLGPNPEVGQMVFVWGTPRYVAAPMLRFGIVGGGDSTAGADSPENKNAMIRWIDVTGGPGDSGSPVFDERGAIVGVVSQGIAAYGFLGVFPLAFTPQQLADIQQ